MSKLAGAILVEYKKVIEQTEGKEDTVSRWARRGVLSEARCNISYLKRRLNSLYAEFPLPKGKIADAERYIQQLELIIEVDNKMP